MKTLEKRGFFIVPVLSLPMEDYLWEFGTVCNWACQYFPFEGPPSNIDCLLESWEFMTILRCHEQVHK